MGACSPALEASAEPAAPTPEPAAPAPGPEASPGPEGRSEPVGALVPAAAVGSPGTMAAGEVADRPAEGVRPAGSPVTPARMAPAAPRTTDRAAPSAARRGSPAAPAAFAIRGCAVSPAPSARASAPSTAASPLVRPAAPVSRRPGAAWGPAARPSKSWSARSRSSSRGRPHWPGGGCHSSTLFPSGSMTQANFPYSESSIFSSTLQPSSFNTLTKAWRSSTR
jgi:hypothetical protein